MKKVVHLTSVHLPFDVRIFHKECKSLARAGYDVTLIVPHDQDEVVDGVRIKAVRRPIGRRDRMTSTIRRVYREALRQDADVYHFHDPELIPIGLLLLVKGKRVIYDIHEDVPSTVLSKYYLPYWSRRLLKWFTERVENGASCRFSALVPATPSISERFVSLNGNTVTIQNFPLLEEMARQTCKAWSERKYSVAYIGVITEKRGIRQMLEAMDLLSTRFPVVLKLAGNFIPGILRDEVAQLSGWKHVDYRGFLSRSEVADLLGYGCAGLVLFHPDPNHVRAQPNKLFEFMSAGIPVIASDFPLWRQIIEEIGCGLLVPPLNPKAIAEAIEYIFTHPQEAENMGQRGREGVEKRYNWTREERKLLQLYAGLTR